MGWLPWEYALILSAALSVFVLVNRRFSYQYSRLLTSFATEASIIAVLYTIWTRAGELSVLKIDGAISNGAWIWDLERTLYMPSEKALQEAMTPHSLLTQAANLYYFVAHVPALGLFLLWLFAYHRERIPGWRNTLALLTGVCLVIQLVPVAPPRLVDSLGVIDTGLAYGQSVYGALGYSIAGQLQAMPSIHVAWAALVGWGMWQEGTNHWRWIGLLHATITSLVVAATGNHYWLDGIAAIAIMIAVKPAAFWLASRMSQLRSQPEQSSSTAIDQPAAA